MTDSNRLFCAKSGCDALILPATSKATGGVCMPCYKSAERRRIAFERENKLVEQNELHDLEFPPLLESFFLGHMLYCIAGCCQEDAFSKEISVIAEWVDKEGADQLHKVYRELASVINLANELPQDITHIRVRVFEQQWQRGLFVQYFCDWKDRVEFVQWKIKKKAQQGGDGDAEEAV